MLDEMGQVGRTRMRGVLEMYNILVICVIPRLDLDTRSADRERWIDVEH